MSQKRTSSRILGDFQLRGFLRKLPKEVEAHLKPAMREIADELLAEMKSRIPSDTGAAREALTAFVAKSGLDAQVGLRGRGKKSRRFFYLRFIEYGTKGYSGERYQREDLSTAGGKHTTTRNRSKMRGRNKDEQRKTKNKTNGRDWFGYYPDIPARPARPFLRPALAKFRPIIRARIAKAINDTLAAAAAKGKVFTRRQK